jgi:hypothetical protein
MWYMWCLVFALFFAVLVRKRRPKEVQPPKPVPFECRFPLDMSAADVGETAANVAEGVVEEETPEGVVVMRYEAPLYHYWAAKAVTYKYLEAVARKYAIVHDGRSNYVNIFRELLKTLEARDKPVVAAPADPLFATFKTYTPSKNAPLVKNRANAYKWRGTLKDLAALKEPPPPPRMSYAEFKKKS